MLVRLSYFFSMEFFYSQAIPEADHALISESAIVRRWLASLDPAFTLQSVRFESVDFVTRKGIRIPLFVKLKAEVQDEQGKRVPGIVMLRGDAVAVLVVLWCEGLAYLLLVDQSRFAIGKRHSLEVVAGMLDWSKDWRKVALAELEEEAGVCAKDEELIDLAGEFNDAKKGYAVSCGLLDERLYFAAIERQVTYEQLALMHDREQEYLDEDEGIRTKVIPYADAIAAFEDSKCFNAVFLYERWLRKQGRALP